MAELPPPPNPQDGRGDLTPERAERLERLERRRTGADRNSAGPTPDQAARLEKLARRRAETSSSSSTGPTPDQAARLEKLAQRSRGGGARGTTGATGATGGSPRPTRRKHPAKNARTAALGMSLATTAGLAGAFATMNRSASAESAGSSAAVIVSGGPTTTASASRVASPATGGSSAQSGAPRSVNVPVPTPQSASTPTTPATTAAPAAPAQPTVVDGAVSRTRWGPVQVEATFGTDGSLVDVVALQAPNDRSTSLRISNYAVPRLTDEALTAQAASVHTVSGATYTSDGYRQSLQSAIDAARGAGVTTIA